MARGTVTMARVRASWGSARATHHHKGKHSEDAGGGDAVNGAHVSCVCHEYARGSAYEGSDRHDDKELPGHGVALRVVCRRLWRQEPQTTDCADERERGEQRDEDDGERFAHGPDEGRDGERRDARKRSVSDDLRFSHTAVDLPPEAEQKGAPDGGEGRHGDDKEVGGLRRQQHKPFERRASCAEPNRRPKGYSVVGEHADAPCDKCEHNERGDVAQAHADVEAAPHEQQVGIRAGEDERYVGAREPRDEQPHT